MKDTERYRMMKYVIETKQLVVDGKQNKAWFNGLPLSAGSTNSSEYVLIKGFPFRFLNKQSLCVLMHVAVCMQRGENVLDMAVDHIDGNKSNNDPNNLEVVTISENVRRASVNRMKGYELEWKDVRPMMEMAYKEGKSNVEVSEHFGIHLQILHTAFQRFWDRKAEFDWKYVIK